MPGAEGLPQQPDPLEWASPEERGKHDAAAAAEKRASGLRDWGHPDEVAAADAQQEAARRAAQEEAWGPRDETPPPAPGSEGQPPEQQ